MRRALDDKNALHFACDPQSDEWLPGTRKHLAVIRHLLKHVQDKGRSLDAQDGAGDTPLMVAARQGDLEAARLLLAAGAAAAAANAFGDTALHIGCRLGHAGFWALLQEQPGAEGLAKMRNSLGR